MVNTLTFVPGESPAHGLRYWEPVIDGQLLRRLLDDASAAETDDVGVDDLVPVLVHNWPGGMPQEVLVLLGQRPTELTTGRVPVFVCAACGDLGCGATTVAVEWTLDTVVWRDFGWETNYAIEDAEGEYDPVTAGPFVFARAQYEAELQRFVDTFATVRAASAIEPDVPPSGRRRP